jgi:hypothetical protein
MQAFFRANIYNQITEVLYDGKDEFGLPQKKVIATDNGTN